MGELADPRLTPAERCVLTALHRRLDHFAYRPVKIAVLAEHADCSRNFAFKALGKLERVGYLDAAPSPRKPKHYRLTAPPSLPPETSRAA